MLSNWNVGHDPWAGRIDRTSSGAADSALGVVQALARGERPMPGRGEALKTFREVSRELAYRLYTICERKGWTEEARAYNGLVVAWPELTKLALAGRPGPSSTQQEMF